MNDSATRCGERLKDKVILVTGSTTGIGEAMVRVFAREGAQVMIHGRRKEAAEALVTEIGENASFITGSLEDPEIPAKLVAVTVAQFGRIDALVNNAAVITSSSPGVFRATVGTGATSVGTRFYRIRR